MRPIITNLTFIYFCAYFFTHLLYIALNYICILLLGISDVYPYFNHVVFNQDELEVWSKSSVFLASAVPTLVIYFLSIFGLILYFNTSRNDLKRKYLVFFVALMLFVFAGVDFLKIVFGVDDFILLTESFEIEQFLLIAIGLLLSIQALFFVKELSRIYLKISKNIEPLRTKSTRVKQYFQYTFLPYTFLVLVFCFIIVVFHNFELNWFIYNEIFRFTFLGGLMLLGALFTYNKNYIRIYKKNNLIEVEVSHIFAASLVMLLIYVLLWFSF